MRKTVHAIEDLFALLDQFGSYPDGVIEIPRRIPGTAFFPGGFGLWNTRPHTHPPALPIGGSIIVGHNFDSEAGFQRSFHHAGESLKSATWRNLLAFLEQVGISPEQCFFTNAYVGLKAGDRAMGAFPGARDHDFVCWCGCAAPCCGRGAHPSRLPQAERHISPLWEPARRCGGASARKECTDEVGKWRNHRKIGQYQFSSP